MSDHYDDDHKLIIGQLKSGKELDSTVVQSGSLELREMASNISRLVIHNDLLHVRNHTKQLVLYVPVSARDEILKTAHSAAHQLADKMYVTLKIRFWWPSLKRDICRHVDACAVCMRKRMPVPARKAPMQIFPAASRFELVHMDLLGGGASWQKSARGNRYILVIVDHFSRYCVAVPIQTQSAEVVAEAFFQNWIMRFGCPMRVHTDQGANFESSLFAELCQRCHIAKSRTLAYHPQSNGACERLNRTLLRLLETSVYECPTDWDLFLPEVCFAYNSTPHRATQRSPYSILFGDEARLPCEFLVGSPSEAEPVNEFVASLIRRVANISETARLAANAAQRTAKDYYDANINSKLYKTGDVVCLRRGQMKVGESSKLGPKWEGPCLVTRVRGVMVEIVMPNDSKRWVHHDRLSGPVPQKFKRTETGKRGRPRKNPVQAAAQPDDSDEENDSPNDVGTVVAQPANRSDAQTNQPVITATVRNDCFISTTPRSATSSSISRITLCQIRQHLCHQLLSLLRRLSS